VTRAKTSDSPISADEGWADSDVGVKDALMEGAAEEQRGKGMLPTPNDNEELIADILRTFDRKGGGQKAETPSEKKPSAWENEYRRRGGKSDLSEWTTVRGEDEVIPFDRPVVQKGDELRDVGSQRLAARVALLKRSPGWMNRVKDILRRYHGDEQKRRLHALIKESNKHFGHWAKAPAKPLWFS
jgi:hypothetical protein